MKTTAELQAIRDAIKRIYDPTLAQMATLEYIEEILRLREEVAGYERQLSNIHEAALDAGME